MNGEIKKLALVTLLISVVVVLGFTVKIFAFDYYGQAAKETGRLAYEDNKEALNISQSEQMGAIDTSICNGSEQTTNLCNVAIKTLAVYDNITLGDSNSDLLTLTGQLTVSATTTLPVNVYYEIKDSLDLSGTSTAKGATQNIISYYTNTGADLVVDWVGVDMTTQLGVWAASIQCSTSTWVGGVVGGSLSGTTTAGIIASSTIASTYDTGDNGVFVIDSFALPGASIYASDTGHASSTRFVLKNNEVLFCTWTPFGATSSDSFTAAGGFTGAGNMIAQVHARGN